MASGDGERWIVVDGRRWRAADPSIPDALRAELVAELMEARRAIGRSGAGTTPRVRDAKVALGERGRTWWETPTAASRHVRLSATIRALSGHRAPRTTCPSDAARGPVRLRRRTSE